MNRDYTGKYNCMYDNINYVKDILNIHNSENENNFISIKESYIFPTNIIDKMVFKYNNQYIKSLRYSDLSILECERTKRASELGFGAPFIKYEIYNNVNAKNKSIETILQDYSKINENIQGVDANKWILLYTTSIESNLDIRELIDDDGFNQIPKTIENIYNKNNLEIPIVKRIKLKPELLKLIEYVSKSDLYIHYDLRSSKNIGRYNDRLVFIDWDVFTINIFINNCINNNINENYEIMVYDITRCMVRKYNTQ